MIRDAKLEFNQQWEALANEGIGGPVPYVPPTLFSVVPASKTNPYLTVTNTGEGYTDMMAATHRPLMPVFDQRNIYYALEFDVILSPNTNVIQALEFEASYCDNNQIYYNNSMQYNNVNPKGHIQAFASSTNVWADTGIVLPTIPTKVRVKYLVDTILLRLVSGYTLQPWRALE